MKLQEAKCDCEYDRPAQRVAKPEEQLLAAMEHIGTLEAENTRLREENRRLREENAQLREENARLHEQVARLEQQLAAARKDSSTSSKPPSSDIVNPKKPRPKGGKKKLCENR